MAAVLFVIAERLRPASPDPPASQVSPVALGFWFLLMSGILVCAAAGWSVYSGGERVFNHLLWALGLVFLGASAVAAWRA